MPFCRGGGGQWTRRGGPVPRSHRLCANQPNNLEQNNSIKMATYGTKRFDWGNKSVYRTKQANKLMLSNGVGTTLLELFPTKASFSSGFA